MNRDTNLPCDQPHKLSKLFMQYTENVKNNAILLGKTNDDILTERKHLHDEWLEHTFVKLRARALKNDKKMLGHEIKMVSKANLMVRRRALLLKLEADQKMYAEELARFGKAFHKERV